MTTIAATEVKIVRQHGFFTGIEGLYLSAIRRDEMTGGQIAEVLNGFGERVGRAVDQQGDGSWYLTRTAW